MQCDHSIPVSDDPIILGMVLPTITRITIVHNRAKWVIINGLEYKKEAAIVLNYSVEDDLPQIVMIESI